MPLPSVEKARYLIADGAAYPATADVRHIASAAALNLGDVVFGAAATRGSASLGMVS